MLDSCLLVIQVIFDMYTRSTFKALSARQRHLKGYSAFFLSKDNRFLKGDKWWTQCIMLAATMFATTYSICSKRLSSTPESSPVKNGGGLRHHRCVAYEM